MYKTTCHILKIFSRYFIKTVVSYITSSVRPIQMECTTIQMEGATTQQPLFCFIGFRAWEVHYWFFSGQLNCAQGLDYQAKVVASSRCVNFNILRCTNSQGEQRASSGVCVGQQGLSRVAGLSLSLCPFAPAFSMPSIHA